MIDHPTRRLPTCGLLVAALFLSACARPPRRFDPIRVSTAVDFRALSSDGFLLSPDPFTGTHTPLGLVFVQFQGGAERRGPDRTASFEYWAPINVPVDSVIALAKAKSRELGGDGLVNIRLIAAPRVFSTLALEPVVASGWELSGLAIKRQ